MSDNLSITSLLPHQAPMVLLDDVVSVQEYSAHCRVRVGVDSVLAPFLDDAGNLPGWFALEILAQTAAVWSGWQQQTQANIQPRMGMLLGARSLYCHQPRFYAGSTLDVHVTLLMQDEKFSSFEGEIIQEGIAVASARLNVYHPDEQELPQLFKQGNMS